MAGGVSHRGDVPGAFGYGKVKLRFRPVKKRSGLPWGVLLYLFGWSIIAFSYCWSKPYLRDSALLPLLRYVFGVVDIFLTPHEHGRVFPTKEILSDVKISRDKNGVPHITSSTLKDAMFAQGYMHANDRLFQMDILRYKAMGKLDIILESEAAQTSDAIFSEFKLLELAEEDFKNLETNEQELLKAYSNGVNTYLTHTVDLPLDYWVMGFSLRNMTLWEPKHTLSIMRLHAIEQSHGWEDEYIHNLLQHVSPSLGAASTMHPNIKQSSSNPPLSNSFPSLGGSAWVLSGSRTSSGKPLLSFDLQAMLHANDGWMLNAIECNELNVTGISLPGVPFIFAGHNGHISWGFAPSVTPNEKMHCFSEGEGGNTCGGGDTMSDNSNSALNDKNNNGSSNNNDNNNNKDNNKNGVCNALRELRRDSKVTSDTSTSKDDIQAQRKRIFPELSKYLHKQLMSAVFPAAPPAVSKSIKAFKETTKACILETDSILKPNFFNFLLKSNSAKGWDHFTAATEQVENMKLNFVYSDIDGNIGATSSGLMPADATTSPSAHHKGDAHEQEGTQTPKQQSINQETFFRLFNPEDGFIILDKSLSHSPESRSYLQFRLASENKVSVKHAQDLLSDVYSPYSLQLKGLAMSINITTLPLSSLRGVNGLEANENLYILRKALKLISNFDGHYIPTAPAPPLLEAFKFELHSEIYKLHGLSAISPIVGSDFSSPILPGANKQRWKFGAGAGIFLLNALEHSVMGNNKFDKNLFTAKALIRGYVKCSEMMGTKDDESWSWSAANKIIYPHAGHAKLSAIFRRFLARGPLPSAGAMDSTFMSAPTQLQYSVRIEDQGNSVRDALNTVQSVTISVRMSVDLGDLEATSYWLPFGTSGRLSSRWYSKEASAADAWGTFDVLCWKDCDKHMSNPRPNHLLPLLFTPKE